MRLDAKLGLRRFPNFHANHRPRRPRRLPPIRHANDQPAVFKQRHILQKPIGIRRHPRQRLIDRSRIDQFPGEQASLRRILNRRQQRQQRRAIFRVRIFLHRPPQRQMLNLHLRRQSAGVRRHERKRPFGIALIFSQMKRHAADQPPDRIFIAKIRPNAARKTSRFRSHQLIELRPPLSQRLALKILQPPHRRRRHGKHPQFIIRRRRQRRDLFRFPRRHAREPGEIVFGKIAGEAKVNRQTRLKFRRPQLKQPCAVESPNA